MVKKGIKLIVLLVLISFFYSCYSYRMMSGSKIKPIKHTGLKISRVITKSGKWIGFTGPVKARIIGGFIIGETKDGAGGYKIVRIPMSEVNKIWMRTFDAGKTIFRVVGITGLTMFLSVVYWGVFGDIE